MTKIVDPSLVANMYSNTSGLARGARTDGGDTTETSSADSGGGPSFAALLETKTREAVDTLRTGEEMSAKAVTGEADLTEVIEAVNSAEVTLQTVVALRDRMISAYQEIMRMPI